MILRPVLNNVLRNTLSHILPSSREAGVGGGDSAAVSAPAGFDWAPPVTVLASGDGFTTDYNAADWIPATTVELWVSTSGNDTTGTGTQALPFRSIFKAVTEAGASAASGVHIRILPGEYTLNERWTGAAPDKNLVVTAEGGAVVSSSVRSVTWALQGSGAYKATRNSVHGIYDTTNIDANGNPTLLAQVADETACAATPNSFATDGVSVWIRTFDSRAPSNTSIKVLLNVTGAAYTVNKRWYIKGLMFEGGNPFVAGTASAHTETIVCEECTFRFCSPNFGGSFNGFIANGVNQAVMVNCVAYGNPNDGFNYKGSSGNSISTKAVEIGCTGYANGTSAGSNFNGSTGHEQCRILRVNGTYYGNFGPQVVDAVEAQSWNLGCEARDSEGVGVQNSSYSAEGTAAMWLDTCSAAGSDYAAAASASSTIRTRNSALSGLTLGDVAPY